MGMPIDESINGIEKRILPIYDNDADHQALVTAIDTMRKYQKIEQIVEHYRENVRDKVTNENMEKILEVVEDGNNKIDLRL